MWHARQADCPALATLPTLTNVTLHDPGDVIDASFLSALPLLQRLSLRARSPRNRVSPVCITDALPRCALITHLIFSYAPLPPSVTDGFQHLAQLRSLTLRSCGAIASLTFLVSMPSRSTLTHLLLSETYPRLPVSELTHLLRLRALEYLSLSDVFDRAPTFAETAGFQPPSRLLPALHTFQIKRRRVNRI